MSAGSGLAAGAVVLALALVAVSEPVWAWRYATPTETQTWSYGVLDARYRVVNTTTGQDLETTYPHEAIPGQPNLGALFVSFRSGFLFSLVATVAGIAFSLLTALRRLRGLYAGIAYLAGCLPSLYVGLNLILALPRAAVDLPTVGGRPILQFEGQVVLNQAGGDIVLTWGPGLAWYLVLGMGLALAYGSSEMWSVRVPQKVPKPAASPTGSLDPPPPPPPEARVLDVRTEPEIEEVFVIAPNGLLVKHMSRSLMTDKDRDVVGGMISVVSNFVQEAFSERDGLVQEVTLGNHRFILCNEGGLVLAVLATRGDTEDIMHRLRHLLACLVDRYGERILRWSGEPLGGIEDELAVLWQPFFAPPPPLD